MLSGRAKMPNPSERANKARIKSLSFMHSNEEVHEMLKKSRRHFTDKTFNVNPSFGLTA